MKKKKFLVLVFFLAFALLFMGKTSADVGNFRGSTNYNRGNSSRDFGYSRCYSSDDSSDYDDSFGSFGFLPYIFSFGHSGGFLIFVIIIIYIFLNLSKKNSKNNRLTTDNIESVPIPEENNLEKLYDRDPNFSEPDFKQWVSRVFIELQNAWQEKNWEPMRAYLSPQLYSKFESQLNELVRENKTNYIKNIAVMNVDIHHYEEDSKNQKLYVVVEARMIDYTEDAYGNVILGDPRREVFMGYGYEIVRSLAAKTADIDSKKMKCPSCGAPVDINRSAKCPYCGTIIQTDKYSWTINDIEALYQDN